YVGGGARGGVPAQLYISPRPTPALVGHTYITYQPLRPQEYLYHHQRTYYTYYGGGTKTVTHVSYGGSFFGSLPIPNRDYVGGPHPMSVGGGLYGWQR
ncbi:MAG: hypothetical protein K8T25_17795, partial [Planctomycetia bacterium]|nr:hypothetical protein [Planctomycetia bacterium]